MSTLEDLSWQAPDPKTGDCKEVYAFYGLASCATQVAERGLMVLALLLRLRRTEGATLATWDREWDAIARRTFGQILNELSEDQALENDLRSLLRRALITRNHLTHHFFWSCSEEFFSQEGCLRMIRELQDAATLFSVVDEGVGRVLERMGNELGVTRQVVDEMTEKLLADARQKYGSA